MLGYFLGVKLCQFNVLHNQFIVCRTEEVWSKMNVGLSFLGIAHSIPKRFLQNLAIVLIKSFGNILETFAKFQ